MLRKLKVHGSFLFLFLFLAPQVQKGLHDFEHRNDTHCDATSEIHLHQLEHVCDFCDFSLAIGSDDTFFVADNYQAVLALVHNSTYLHFFTNTLWSAIPSRGPPVFYS